MDYFYAQLNSDNICVGVSNLAGEVPEYNYAKTDNYNPVTGETTSESVFISRMIRIPVYTNNYNGLQYNEDGTWSNVPVTETQ